MNLGKRIEAERKRRGWTQANLIARVPGLTQQALDRLEKRDSMSSAFTLGIATAFDLTFEQLLLGTSFVLDAKQEHLPASIAATVARLAELLDALPDGVRELAAQRLATLAHAPDSQKARAALVSALDAPADDKGFDQKEAA